MHLGANCPYCLGVFCTYDADMDDTVKLQLRLDERLHQALVKAAERNHRSLNAELNARLAQSLEPSPLEARIAALEQIIKKVK
jgi:hypothetical protein